MCNKGGPDKDPEKWRSWFNEHLAILAMALIAVAALFISGCSNTEDDPRPVDPPDCWPHCTTVSE